MASLSSFPDKSVSDLVELKAIGRVEFSPGGHTSGGALTNDPSCDLFTMFAVCEREEEPRVWSEGVEQGEKRD